MIKPLLRQEVAEKHRQRIKLVLGSLELILVGTGDNDLIDLDSFERGLNRAFTTYERRWICENGYESRKEVVESVP